MDTAAGIAITSFLVGLSGAMMPGPVLTVTIGETVARLREGTPTHAPKSPTAASQSLEGGRPIGGRGRSRGAMVGPLIVLGHGMLEILLVAGVVLGLGELLVRGPVIGLIGILGSVVLLWMAWGMFRSVGGISLRAGEVSRSRRHPILAGVLTTLSNPYWTIWWATIGLGYIALSLRLGPIGLVAFYLGHVLSDLAWYGTISVTLALGGGLLTDRLYRVLVTGCAVFLLGFGVYFGYAGARYLFA
jgi:threonine/homoserine/homoserine lactone efflux protein